MRQQEQYVPKLTLLPSSNPPSYLESGLACVQHQNHLYQVRKLDEMDEDRHTSYQQLRGDVFVRSLGWSIPIDEIGREKDQYDELQPPWISTHCVFILQDDQKEFLLGGVRVFKLSHWEQSMTFNEFRSSGMIPDTVLDVLQNTYRAHNMIELTRLCVVRNKQRISLDTPFVDFAAVRDYVYACAYAHAEEAQCRYALAIVDYAYYIVCKRSNFIFDELYSRFERHQRGGYALVAIDLPATIAAIQASGDYERARRMVQLCQDPSLFLKG